MNRQSAKRRKLANRRATFVRRFLKDHPHCQVGWDRRCQSDAVDVHEPLTRARGGSIVDPNNALAACRPCHDAIHAHPVEAMSRGFLRSQFPGRNPDRVWVDDPPQYRPDDHPAARTEAFLNQLAQRYGLGR